MYKLTFAVHGRYIPNEGREPADLDVMSKPTSSRRGDTAVEVVSVGLRSSSLKHVATKVAGCHIDPFARLRVPCVHCVCNSCITLIGLRKASVYYRSHIHHVFQSGYARGLPTPPRPHTWACQRPCVVVNILAIFTRRILGTP